MLSLYCILQRFLMVLQLEETVIIISFRPRKTDFPEIIDLDFGP